MLSIFYPGLEIKLKHTWPCSKFAYAYKKKACNVFSHEKMGCISVKNEVSPKRNENRKKLHTVFPRHLIFRHLQEVLKLMIFAWVGAHQELP